MVTRADISYVTLITPAVTSWNGLVSDTNLLAGAHCAKIDNTTEKAVDYSVQFEFKLSSTTPTANRQIAIYCARSLNDTLWTGGIANTDAAQTLVANQLALLKPVALLGTDATGSMVLTHFVESLRDLIGPIPQYFSFWIAQSTAQALFASGNAVRLTPLHYTNN